MYDRAAYQIRTEISFYTHGRIKRMRDEGAIESLVKGSRVYCTDWGQFVSISLVDAGGKVNWFRYSNLDTIYNVRKFTYLLQPLKLNHSRDAWEALRLLQQ